MKIYKRVFFFRKRLVHNVDDSKKLFELAEQFWKPTNASTVCFVEVFVDFDGSGSKASDRFSVPLVPRGH